jgi:hypothetical protein
LLSIQSPSCSWYCPPAHVLYVTGFTHLTRRHRGAQATFATREMWSFVHNWWYHAQKAAMPGLLVIAMDDETKDKCDAAGGLPRFLQLRCTGP